MDGRTIPGQISQAPGGVGRNLADCLGKITQTSPLFISAIGKDQFGDFLLNSLPHIDKSGIKILKNGRTACYSALIDVNGEAKFGIGDMDIHSTINQLQILSHETAIKNSSIIIMDGNIPQQTINNIIELGITHNKPVWFEPTDVLKSVKPFKSELWQHLSFISPNLNELKEMAASAGGYLEGEFDMKDINKLLKQILHLAQPLAAHIPCIMVTMGKLGILMVTKQKSDSPVKDIFRERDPKNTMARYYPTTPLRNVTNSLGAGDSAAAGFIEGVLRGLTEPECVTLGHSASIEALQSKTAIPKKFTLDRKTPIKAQFVEIKINENPKL